MLGLEEFEVEEEAYDEDQIDKERRLLLLITITLMVAWIHVFYQFLIQH